MAMEKHTMTVNELHIPLNDGVSMIVQNKSGCPILWSVTAESEIWFNLAGGETIIVDFDIWAKSDGYSSLIVVGRV